MDQGVVVYGCFEHMIEAQKDDDSVEEEAVI